MNWKKCKIRPNTKVKLSKINTDCDIHQSLKKKLNERFIKNTEEIGNFQNILFAENRQSLLIILQGMDSSGKDGTIKQIMREVNPLGLIVHSFKHPSELELEHDYLWRHAQKLPEHGQITIFNRSHYENVLISKVHPEIVLAERLPGIKTTNDINKKFWRERYQQINYFEKSIVQNGTHILKFFLHLSKKEQGLRFLERIKNKEKHWKFTSADIAERRCWDEYQTVYEEAINNTSTKIAPWYIIPADDKWHAHTLIAEIILEEFKEMNPSFPPIDEKEKMFMKQAKAKLKKENKRT